MAIAVPKNARGFFRVIVVLCAAAVPVAWLQFAASSEDLKLTRAELADLPQQEVLESRLQGLLAPLLERPGAAAAPAQAQAVVAAEQAIKAAGSEHLILDPETPAYFLAYLFSVKWPERAGLTAFLAAAPGGALPADASARWAAELPEESRALDLALAEAPPDQAEPLRLQQKERLELAQARPFDRGLLRQAAEADARLWLMSLRLMRRQLEARAAGLAWRRDLRLGLTVALLLALLGSAAALLRRLMAGSEAEASEAAAKVLRLQWEFFDRVPFGVMVFDVPSLVIHRCNPAFAEMLGEPEPIAPGSSLRPYFAAGEIERLEAITRAGTGGLTTIRRWVMRTRQGTIRTLESGGQPFPWDGKPARMVLVRDVTVEVGLEAKILADERSFRVLNELSSEAVLLADANRTVIYATPSLEQLLGYSPEERLGTKVFALAHPDDAEAALARSAAVRAQDGVRHVFRTRMRHKDGRWRVIELSSVSHLQDPALACVVSNLRDVTESAELEREAAASEAHYRAVVENADDLLLYYRRDAGLRVENPAALTQLGLGPDFRFSADSLGRVHPEDLPAVIGAVDRALKEPGRAFALQARIRGQDGAWRDFEGRGRGLSGHPGVLITLRDVTDSRSVQRQLVRYERLAAIGQTASGLAHEVRNPLAVVSATAEYLKQQLKDRPVLGKELDAVLEAVERIRDLVSDVLERSRDRELQRSLEPADQLMDQACRAAQLRFGPAGERVRVLRSYGAVPPALKVDPRQMDRVLSNLMLNALQAMRGEGTLTLSASVDGQAVRLEVADDGPGIPEAELAKVFEPFFTTKEQGSGLGLWICKGIVEEHGGQLTAQNRKPRGCAFTVTLPAEAGA